MYVILFLEGRRDDLCWWRGSPLLDVVDTIAMKNRVHVSEGRYKFVCTWFNLILAIESPIIWDTSFNYGVIDRVSRYLIGVPSISGLVRASTHLIHRSSKATTRRDGGPEA